MARLILCLFIVFLFALIMLPQVAAWLESLDGLDRDDLGMLPQDEDRQ